MFYNFIEVMNLNEPNCWLEHDIRPYLQWSDPDFFYVVALDD